MPEYLSYSQIAMYLRCSQSYYYRYIEGKSIPPGIALIKGRSAHTGIEFNFGQKIESHKDLPKKDIVDFTVNEYEKIVDEEDIFLTKEEKETDAIGKAKDSIVTVCELYSDKVAPEIQPVEVEVKHTMEIPDSKPLVAIIDCIDDKKSIRDFKITGKSKNQNEAENSLQLTFYAMAYYDRFNSMPSSLSLDALVTLKTPKYQILQTKRTEMDIITAIRTIQAVQKGIESEVFLPAAEGSWVCSSKFCGFYKICKYKNKISF